MATSCPDVGPISPPLQPLNDWARKRPFEEHDPFVESTMTESFPSQDEAQGHGASQPLPSKGGVYPSLLESDLDTQLPCPTGR